MELVWHRRRWVGAAILATLLLVTAATGCAIVPPGRFLAASSTTVYASSDGGDIWTATAGQPTSHGNPPESLTGIAETNLADVAVGAAGGVGTIWISQDRGTTWTVAWEGGSPIIGLSCAAQTCAAIANEGSVRISHDQGVSWTAAGAATAPPVSTAYWRVVGITVTASGGLVAASSDRGAGTIATATSYVHESTDGGANWTTTALPANNGLCLYVNTFGFVASQVVAAGDALVAVGWNQCFDRPLFVSPGVNAAWTESSSAPPTGSLSAAATDDATVVALKPQGRAGAGAAGSTTNPLVYVSADRGATWTPASTNPSFASPAAKLGIRGADAVLVDTANGGISVLVSHDAGATWAPAIGQPPGAPNLTAITD